MRSRTAVLVPLIALLLVQAPAASAYQRPGQTRRIAPTVDVDGKAAFVGGLISSDGGSAILVTASPLVASDKNGTEDVYVRDLASGTVERVSLTSDGKEPNGACNQPSSSHGVRYVAFACTATNIVPGDSNGARDVFVRDREAQTTTLVSVTAAGVPAAGVSSEVVLSADGRTAAFLSYAANLVSGDSNLYADIFVRHLGSGTTERVSLTSDGTQTYTNPSEPEISGDGRHVAFVSHFPFVADDTNGVGDVYVRDLVTGHMDRASVASDGSEGTGSPSGSFNPSISADGRFVAFGSTAASLVPNDSNGFTDVFIRDLQAGVTERITSSMGEQANGVVGSPRLSADGRYVVGHFLATNLGYPDPNGNSTDVYRYDRLTHVTELVSTTAGGTTGNSASGGPSISHDGRSVAFGSLATDLVDDGVGGGFLGYLRDMGPSLGTGLLELQREGDDVFVSGWARLSAGPISSTQDPAGDAPAAAPLGADLRAASVTYRPEERDVLAVLDLVPYRHTTSAGARVPLTFGLDVTVSGVPHQVRAVQGSDGSSSFSLSRCLVTCEVVGDLTGGIGTQSDRTLISIPLSVLGVGEGATLTDVTAFTALGDLVTGQLRVLDASALSASTIPRSSVAFSTSPAGSDPGTFGPPVSFSEGLFAGALPAPVGGAHDAWARVCLGEACATSFAPIV